ncbi:13779_t:CDS:2, partial [Cetraspora pellucida]
MPEVSYLNKRNTISAAINELNSYPVGTKCLSVNRAVRNFGLSEATLQCAIKKGGSSNHWGPSTILTEHEKNQLVGYCMNMQQLGFGLTKSGVNHCVMKIIHYNKRPYPFRDKGPGRDWWTRFMRQHPELSFRTSQELSKASAQRANPIIVKNYFNKLEQIINENLLTATQIWNIDETGFVLVPKLEKVIAKKGSCQVHKVAHSNSHEHISVVLTISATSLYIPPLVIYKLMSENKMLKNEIESLKVQFTVTQEELGTYKSPRTSSLCSVFKYIPHVLQAGPLNTSLVNQQEPGPFSKKRKMLLFAQLLTNDESWGKLKETNEEAERKVEEVKRKKVLAAQKKIERQQKLKQKKEEREQKKREKDVHK